MELLRLGFKGMSSKQIMQKSRSTSSSEEGCFSAFFGGRPRLAGVFVADFLLSVFEVSRFSCFSRNSSRLSEEVRIALFIGRRPLLDLTAGAVACRGPANDKIVERLGSWDDDVDQKLLFLLRKSVILMFCGVKNRFKIVKRLIETKNNVAQPWLHEWPNLDNIRCFQIADDYMRTDYGIKFSL